MTPADVRATGQIVIYFQKMLADAINAHNAAVDAALGVVAALPAKTAAHIPKSAARRDGKRRHLTPTSECSMGEEVHKAADYTVADIAAISGRAYNTVAVDARKAVLLKPTGERRQRQTLYSGASVLNYLAYVSPPKGTNGAQPAHSGE